MDELRSAVRRVAESPYPVLVTGESGSGKELVARAIHRLSRRTDRCFGAVNCAALTDELVEAELFGCARGAFTGAVTERAGLFEAADRGTLFLDEVGELSARAQAKLLRVLQDGEIRRLGENLPRRVDVRVVSATNRPLEADVSTGRFREDLLYRVDVLRIALPPLRDRDDDVLLLAEHFWRQAQSVTGSRVGPLSLAGQRPAARERHRLAGRAWPPSRGCGSIHAACLHRGRDRRGQDATAGACAVRAPVCWWSTGPGRRPARESSVGAGCDATGPGEAAEAARPGRPRQSEQQSAGALAEHQVDDEHRAEDAGGVGEQTGRHGVPGLADAHRAVVHRERIKRGLGAALKGADHVADQ